MVMIIVLTLAFELCSGGGTIGKKMKIGGSKQSAKGDGHLAHKTSRDYQDLFGETPSAVSCIECGWGSKRFNNHHCGANSAYYETLKIILNDI